MTTTAQRGRAGANPDSNVRLRARLASCSLALLLSALSVTAHADERCLLRLDSAGGEVRVWANAIRALEAELGDSPNDCAVITITPDAAGEGARVDLATRDGRAASRRIGEANELAPLVRALLVATPSKEPPPTAAADPAPTPATTPTTPEGVDIGRGRDQDSSPAADVPAGAPAKPKQGILVIASAGLKVPSADSGGPTGQIFAGYAPGHWELGGFGRWEFERDLTDGATGHSSVSAVGGGALVGRRQAIGPILIVFGTTAGAYAADEEHHRRRTAIPSPQTPGSRIADTFFEPRLGAYLGSVFPITPTFRLRGQLDAEAALASHTPSNSALATPPGWGLGLAIGIEAGL